MVTTPVPTEVSGCGQLAGDLKVGRRYKCVSILESKVYYTRYARIIHSRLCWKLLFSDRYDKIGLVSKIQYTSNVFIENAPTINEKSQQSTPKIAGGGELTLVLALKRHKLYKRRRQGKGFERNFFGCASSLCTRHWSLNNLSFVIRSLSLSNSVILGNQSHLNCIVMLYCYCIY